MKRFLTALLSVALLFTAVDSHALTKTIISVPPDKIIPDLSGHSGEFLSNNGTSLLWTVVSATGDVVGPSGATDDDLPTFDGGTGKLIKDSQVKFSYDATYNGGASTGRTLHALHDFVITPGPAERLQLKGGDAVAANTTGGTVVITSGQGTGTGDSGGIAIFPLDAGLTGNGGAVQIQGGNGGNSTGNGGQLDLTGGSAFGNGNGGSLLIGSGSAYQQGSAGDLGIYGGDDDNLGGATHGGRINIHAGTSASQGGDVTIQGGTGNGGADGKIYLADATSGFTAEMGLVLLSDNRKYQWPDNAGTIALVGDNISEFNNDSGYGSGSVTSIDVTGANGIGVSGNPITGSGTIALSLVNITPNSVTSAIHSSNNIDPADTGIFRLGNNETVAWEANPTGTDLTITMDTNNVFTPSTPINTPTGYRIGNAAGAGKILIGNGTNYVASTPTYPNTSATAGKVIISDGTNYVASTPTFPNASATALKHIKSDGTNWVATTATISDSPGTAGKVMVSDGTNWATSTPTFPNASATSGKFIRSDGTNWVASTPTLPTSAGTSGKVLQSDGTNYVESTPTYPSASGTAGKVVRSDGTNNVYSTYTIPDTYSQGDILYASAANTLTALAKNTSATRALCNTGTSNNPAWCQIDVTSGITGIQPLANGGTNSADYTTATATYTNKRITKRVVALSDATSFTLSADTADMNTQANTQAVGTLTANSPSGTPTDGQLLAFRIKSTNVQTYSWNAIFRGTLLPTTSTGGSKTDYELFMYNSADTKWDIVAHVANF